MQVNLVEKGNKIIHVADGALNDVEQYINSIFNRFPPRLYGTWVTRKELSMKDDYCFVTIQRAIVRNDLVSLDY